MSKLVFVLCVATLLTALSSGMLVDFSSFIMFSTLFKANTPEGLMHFVYEQYITNKVFILCFSQRRGGRV